MLFINNLLYHLNIRIDYYNQCAFYCVTINCIKKKEFPNQTFYCINLITCIATPATTTATADTTTTAPTNAAADTAASVPNAYKKATYVGIHTKVHSCPYHFIITEMYFILGHQANLKELLESKELAI